MMETVGELDDMLLRMGTLPEEAKEKEIVVPEKTERPEEKVEEVAPENP